MLTSIGLAAISIMAVFGALFAAVVLFCAFIKFVVSVK